MMGFCDHRFELQRELSGETELGAVAAAELDPDLPEYDMTRAPFETELRIDVRFLDNELTPSWELAGELFVMLGRLRPGPARLGSTELINKLPRLGPPISAPPSSVLLSLTCWCKLALLALPLEW